MSTRLTWHFRRACNAEERYCYCEASILLWRKKDPTKTAIPDSAIVKRIFFCGDSRACLLWAPSSLTDLIASLLEDSAASFELLWNWISWLSLSRSLIYLLHLWHNSVRFPHISWCLKRSTAGSGNSQYSHVMILWGQFSPLWTDQTSRSTVSLHNEHSTGACISL